MGHRHWSCKRGPLRGWTMGLAIALAATACWAHAAAPAEPEIQVEIDDYELSLDFDDSMQAISNRIEPGTVRLESMAGKAVATDCHWDDDTRIACGFDNDDRPVEATEYRVRLAAGLKTQDGRSLPARSFVVQTPRPTLRSGVGWGENGPTIDLYSEQKVSAADAASVLRLSIDGRATPPVLEAVDAKRNSSYSSYRLRLPPIAARSARVELSIVPGLRSSLGPLRGDQNRVMETVMVNEPFRVIGAACAQRDAVPSRTPVDGRIELDCLPDETVQLVFSQPLAEDSRKAWVAAWPQGVELYARKSWTYGYQSKLQRESGEAIGFGRDSAQSDFSLNVDGLRSLRGETIQPVSLRVRTLGYRPVLRGARSSALIADGRKPPVLLEAVGASGGQWPLRGLDEQWMQNLQRGPLQIDAAPRPLPSAAVGSVLARDGWVALYSNQADSQHGPYRPLAQFSAPAFDLFATGGAGEVLVWAQQWGDGAAVADAEVELLLQSSDKTPARIARGRTDAHGLARLSVPARFEFDERSRDQRLIVRATHGRGSHARRAVLPADSGFSWRVLRRAAETRVWGVTDKPLYRSGETVRYKLWLRRLAGERLLAPGASAPVELRLTRQYDPAIVLSWTERFDEGGSLSGERGLPSQLPDGDYCIRGKDDYHAQGACFFVGTFRAQDLWAQASAEDRVLHDGERFAFDISAGYYSGGAAADLEIGEVTATLSPLPLQQAYPQYADFRFVDVSGEGAHTRSIPGAGVLKLRTDAQGQARGELKLAFDDASADSGERSQLPAFGRLLAVASVRMEGREGTTSNAASARYSRYRRYVGLRSDPQWFDARSPIRLEAVVIEEDGREVADAPVEIEVRWLSGWEESQDDADAPVLHRCSLRTRQPARCDFPRARSGRYLISARSGDAAPARLSQYVWAGGREGGEWTGEPQLQLIRAASAQDRSVEVQLRQPYAKAQVLFVFENGRELMGQRIESVDGELQRYTLALPDTRAHSYGLVAHVRETAPSKIDERGFRAASRRVNAQLKLVPPPAASVAEPVSVSFSAASARPGERVLLRVRNPGTQPRDLAVSVMDDALRSLAGKGWEWFDPQGMQWLGALKDHSSYLASAGFDDAFAGGVWKIALPWPGDAKRRLQWPGVMFDADKAQPSGTPFAPDAGIFDSGDPKADAAAAAAAADAAASANCAQCSLQRIAEYRQPAPPPPPPPAPRESTRGPRVAQAPPMPVADGYMRESMAPGDRDFGSSSLELAQVVVTGSRITLESTAIAGPGKIEGLQPHMSFDPTAIAGSGKIEGAQPRDARESAVVPAATRVRTRFVDTVHWIAQLRLAPGESREIELTLPDNLTRWRAVVWSNDADDDFGLSEATLEVGLPLEARLQTPVRLYPGDRSLLAANARQSGERASDVATQLQVVDARAAEGAELARADARLSLAPRGQGGFGLEIAPRQIGQLLATASVQAGAERDAVAAAIEVATPSIAGRRSQAGWLGAQPLSLDLPELPAGASQPQLQLSLLRGSAALVERWTDDLHRYPHRCWEQILSRGVAAALSLQRGDSTPWPQEEAQAAVREAVENAAVFQGQGGDFRYFIDSDEQTNGDHDSDDAPQAPHIALSAYSLRALTLLTELGHPVEADVLTAAGGFIAAVDVPGADKTDAASDAARNEAAIAVGADTKPTPGKLDGLWKQWPRLALPAQIELTRALARSHHAGASEAVARLAARTQRRGQARVLQAHERLDRWMSSDLREQCALIGLLRDYPALAGPDLRRGLIAGLSDLYAGGIEAVDTQTGAYCLWALNEDVRNDARDGASAAVALGAQRAELKLAPGEQRQDWQASAPRGERLSLTQTSVGDTPLSYVATLDYVEDARKAVANAIGLAVTRRFEVLREGGWRPVKGATVRENDWLRITLTVRNSATRYFVAITDNVAGGLFPTDLTLSGIAGLDLAKVSDTGSYSFQTRRLDPRKPRFYAELLPPGEHEVHYFARAANAGDYLAAPAQVELMYGSATQARTAAERVSIAPAQGRGE
ncbi:alpha-2-macroglobulin family protein [Pseudomonas sp. CGJS7]|uniref:alpha-2-macroglobulin family protein n=1 Tax=Pseudomonas sp. CGJS7 TaxID=3109348 RepID=UPI003008E4AB